MASTSKNNGATINVAPFLEVLLVIFVVLIVIANLDEVSFLSISDDLNKIEEIRGEIERIKNNNVFLTTEIEALEKEEKSIHTDNKITAKAVKTLDSEDNKVYADIERIKNQITQLKVGFSKGNYLYFFFTKDGRCHLNGVALPCNIITQVPKNYSKQYTFYFSNDGSNVAMQNAQKFSSKTREFGFSTGGENGGEIPKIIKNAFGD